MAARLFLVFATIVALACAYYLGTRAPVDCPQLAISITQPDPFPYTYQLNCRDGRTVYLAH